MPAPLVLAGAQMAAQEWSSASPETKRSYVNWGGALIVIAILIPLILVGVGVYIFIKTKGGLGFLGGKGKSGPLSGGGGIGDILKMAVDPLNLSGLIQGAITSGQPKPPTPEQIAETKQSLMTLQEEIRLLNDRLASGRITREQFTNRMGEAMIAHAGKVDAIYRPE